MRSTLLLLFLVVLSTSLTDAQKSKSRRRVKKASYSLCGTVVEKRGNQMPGPGRPQSAGEPVVREVLVLPLLTLEQVTSDEAGFITDLKGAQPLQTVRSGKDGKFCFATLPAGRYSVLVRKEKGLYANLYDTQNHINPVTVEKGKAATVTIQITHRATF